MRPLFSIIIPVYNSERYIFASVKSVLKQKFSKKKFEIILINDCSTDNSKSIINKIKRRSSNIKVINNKINKKVSYCRNIGIKKAVGKYIIFLDSDDELKKNALLDIEKIIMKDKILDLILCLQFKTNKLLINKKTKEKLNTVEKFLNYENKRNIYNPNCWNMILRRKFLLQKKIFFRGIDIFEDQVFCTEVLFNLNKLKIYPGTFHNYIQRPFSLSRITGKIALKSCMNAILNFQVLKQNKLTKHKISFIKNRENFILHNTKKYIAISSLNEIKKIALNYKKKFRIMSLKKNIYYENFFSLNNMLKIKQKVTSKILKQNFKKFDSIYVFGFGINGRTIFHIIDEKKLRIEGFLDNESNFQNKIYFGKKIINPKKLKMKLKKGQNILVIISHNLKSKDSRRIIKQLYKLGLHKKNIRSLNIP